MFSHHEAGIPTICLLKIIAFFAVRVAGAAAGD